MPIHYEDADIALDLFVSGTALGHSFLPRAAVDSILHDNAETTRPVDVLDRPSGRRFAHLRRPINVGVVSREVRGQLLVQVLVGGDAPFQISVRGWIPADAITRHDYAYWSPGPVGGHLPGRWGNIPGLPGFGLRRVRLAEQTRLHERPGGRIIGNVVTADDFLFMTRRGDWVEVAVGHPFGMTRAWVEYRRRTLVFLDSPAERTIRTDAGHTLNEPADFIDDEWRHLFGPATPRLHEE